MNLEEVNDTALANEEVAETDARDQVIRLLHAAWERFLAEETADIPEAA